MTVGTTYFYGLIPIKYSITDEDIQEILTQFPLPSFPAKENVFDLQQQEKGDLITLNVLLNDFSVHLTRQQKQFIRLNLSNNAGVMQAVIWDNKGEVERYKPMLETYSLFTVEGSVHEYNNQKSITIRKLTPFTEDVRPANFLPATDEDIETLTIELFAYLNELNEPYRTVAWKTMEIFWEQFMMSPAAKSFHHNYLGGLLKHTVGLMRFARYILVQEEDHFKAIMKLIHIVEKAYKQELWDQLKHDSPKQRLIWHETLDHLYGMFNEMITVNDETPHVDLVMISILFHDLGKLLEYDYAGRPASAFEFLFPTGDYDFTQRKETGITFDEFGQMIGHIPYGFIMFVKMLERENISLPLADIHTVSHCILSHHGLPEWGSAVRKPLTIEAFIVHLVDFLDSRYENVL